MPSLSLLLMSMTLAALPTATAPPAVSPDAAARATLRQVAQMTPAQQQAWLRELKSRLDWADRLTLKPKEAARQQTRIAALLQQKTVSLQTVLQLLRELDGREKDAIARLVAQYRSQVYETFHDQGQPFHERQEAWYQVWDKWQQAGSPVDQQDRLMDWLAGAIRNSAADKIGPLPVTPQFAAQREPPTLPTLPPIAKVVPPAAIVNESEGDSPIFVGRKLGQSPKKAAEDLDAGKVGVVRHPLESAPPLPEPIVAAPQPNRRTAGVVVAPPAEVAAIEGPRPPHAVPVIVPDRRNIEQRPAAEQLAAALPPRLRQRRPVTVAVPAEAAAPSLVLRAPQTAAEPHATTTTTTGPARGDMNRSDDLSAALPKPPAVGQQSGPQASAALTPARLSPRATIEPRPALNGKEPPARPSPWDHDLIAMLPVARPIPPMASPREGDSPIFVGRKLGQSPIPSPAAETKPAAVVATAPAVRVNTEELTAQIAGNNLSLRNLEAELDEKQPWDAVRLEAVVARLDTLVVKHQDLLLFRDLTTPAEQVLLGSIRSPQQALAALKEQVAAACRRARGSDFTDTETQRQAELRRLDALATRLDNLGVEP